MTTSTHLKLPFILPAQAGKHVTHNEAIAALDTLAQLAVLDRDLAAPPASPAEGDRYIVAAGPTGAWAGKAGQIAAWDGAAWLFHAPEPGWIAYLVDESGIVVWTGTAWQPTVGLDGKVPRLGINAAADDTNRLAVDSEAVLFTNASAGVQVKLNKHSSGDTASLLYQTSFSGRAELGTAGDDNLHIKVSPDGSAWTEALVVDTSGKVGIGTASPAVKLDVDGPIRCKPYTVAGVPAASAGAGQMIFVSNEAGGATLAFSDGTNWRRVADRAVVS
ncbi:MAG: DUF2793 domain-containing protein [Devosia sp.]|uniref:DUF2793 domain-containing protein n=1 Tax=Devosia sp. TaxID=1871048 RepID=UPI001AC625F9|nr:DUF2793 domain-containing protein [Devosia sp.]MBN9309880.1 DUF2793 domain-containing protein [Devosia sp.]MBN9316334.1 DUF2793 domain-containing protein [Devosia sp.]